MDDEVEVEEVEEGLGKLVALTRLGLPHHHHHHPHHHKQSSPQLIHQGGEVAFLDIFNPLNFLTEVRYLPTAYMQRFLSACQQ